MPKYSWNDRSHDSRFENFLKTGNPWSSGIMKILCEELQRFIKRIKIKTPDELERYKKEAINTLTPKAVGANNPAERVNTCVKQYLMFWKEKLRLYGKGTKKNPKIVKDTPNGKSYLPTKKDCEKAIENLKLIKLSNKISVDDVLDSIEGDFKNRGVRLKNNWRSSSKENFRIWWSK